MEFARRSLLMGIAGGGTAGWAALRPQTAAGDVVDVSELGLVGDGIADDTDALQALLDMAFASDRSGLAVLPGGRYRVTRPLSVKTADRPGGNITRPAGLIANGAVILSEIADPDRAVLEIDVRSVVRYVRIEGLSIAGRGGEGDGLRIVCERRGAYFYNFSFRDCVVEGCGGTGLVLIGNVFEGQIANCYFRDNSRHGALMAHGDEDTVLSAVHCFGCVFGGNDGVGLLLKDGATDVSCYGSYFLLNGLFGLSADHGITLLSHCGFENNHQSAADFENGDSGIRLFVSGTLIGCTAYSIYNQRGLIRAYVTNELTLVGCTGSGGQRASKAGLAEISGQGNAVATMVGCHGRVERGDGVHLNAIGGGGVAMGGDWDSPNKLSLGGYQLWVDGDGHLRMSEGAPESDKGGTVVGA